MRNNNPTISLDLNRIFDLKGESTNIIADFIQPIVPITRIINIIRNATGTNATSTVLYTTPSDKDFYLTNASLSLIKDATATSNISTITVVVEGVTQRIISIIGLTLTAQAETNYKNFNIPIKLDRNTAITITHSTNVGNVSANGIIMGYTVETTK